MKDVTNQPRLHRRPSSQSYYFRARIPSDLIDHYGGKKEISFSLRTSIYRDAIQKCRIESVKLDQEFDRIRRERELLEQQQRQQEDAWAASQEIPHSTTISDIEIERLTATVVHHVMTADEEDRVLGLSDDDFERIECDLIEAEYEYPEALARGKIEVVEDMVDEWLRHARYDLDKSTLEYRKVAFAFLKALLASQRLRADRQAGNVIDTPPIPPGSIERNGVVVNLAEIMRGEVVGQAMAGSASGAAGGPKLSEVFDKWADERKPPETTRVDFGTQIRRFNELNGDLPVSQINKAHVRKFKDALLECPRNFPHKMRGKPFPDLLKWAKANPDRPRVSPRTINDKALAALRSVLSYAVQNGYRDDNPATGIKVATGKVQNTSRLPYSIDDMNQLFRSPVFVDDKERPKAGAGEAAKWLPLLAAFTGARLEELGQLRVEDVAQEQGIWFFDMSTIEDGKRLKTESSRRRVPIHQTLMDLGLMEYVEERRRAGDVLLFPKLKPTAGKLTSSWSKWWSRYARQHGPEDRRKVFHSFRHTAKDGFRDSDVMESLRDALMGHAPRTEGERYGSGYSLVKLNEGMQKLKYPGLDLRQILKR